MSCQVLIRLKFRHVLQPTSAATEYTEYKTVIFHTADSRPPPASGCGSEEDTGGIVFRKMLWLATC